MTTKIEWTDETWNPVRGCSKVSAGCENCYAMAQAHRFSGPGKPYEGLTHLVKGKGPQWTGKVRCVEAMLEKPLHWRKPRKVFVNSMSDLFHPDVPFSFVDKVFAVMAICPWHTFQVLTKRPERMRNYMQSRAVMFDAWKSWEHPVQKEIEKLINRRPTPEDAGLWEWPLPNVWLGVSVENQAAADERISHLLQTPAVVRWLSMEPLLGPIDLDHVNPWDPSDGYAGPEFNSLPSLDWVVAGGESGPKARPMHNDWVRSIRDQCQAAGVPFLFKQWGAWTSAAGLLSPGKWPDAYVARDPDCSDSHENGVMKVGKKAAGRELDGKVWDEYPKPGRVTT